MVHGVHRTAAWWLQQPAVEEEEEDFVKSFQLHTQTIHTSLRVHQRKWPDDIPMQIISLSTTEMAKMFGTDDLDMVE